MKYLIFSVLLIIFTISVTIADDDPSKILIVYNTNFTDNNDNGIGDSEETAVYYASLRSVPSSNILAIATINGFTYSNWNDFYNQLVIPIMDKIDSLGESNIFYILLSYGIPARVRTYLDTNRTRGVDNMLYVPGLLDSADGHLTHGGLINYVYGESSPSVGSDKGHFRGTETYGGKRLFLVTRLDGIDVEYSKGLVDKALYAEKYIISDSGYYNGIGYVDSRFSEYPDSILLSRYPFGYNSYAQVDSSIAFGKFFIENSFFKLKWEPYETEIGESLAMFSDGSPADSAPNALWYGGWYNYNRYQDRWEWIPGAAACDLNSNSGNNIRNSDTQPFLANAFKRGLTCGAGVVAEPFTIGHARPEVFLYYILSGYNFAEASCLSEQRFMWMGIYIGDPIYNPLKSKLLEKDTIPPPHPEILLHSHDDTAIVSIEIPTSVEFPELVKARTLYGQSRFLPYDSTDWTELWRVRHKFILDGLMPDSIYYLKIEMVDPVGNKYVTPGDSFICGRDGLLEVYEIAEKPESWRIDAYPNPFNSALQIACSFDADIIIQDLTGHIVTRFRGKEVIWKPGDNITDGIYLIKANHENFQITRKVIYLK